MNSLELSKVYNPKEFEDRIYEFWLKNNYFKPKNIGKAKPFVMVMPPPNVTGILHMGHALNNILPDILIRYYRMKGRAALWVPGTDHAGIATQNVVEKQLKAQNLKKEDLGRDEFVKRTWEVKDKHHEIITRQLKKIGCSCDWDRERFTLDSGLSDAVRETFVTLYEKGLIYKGNYLVNYCPRCSTALSNEEVEYENVNSNLWEINYPLTDGKGFITVATTRPETMFGDVAIAVNPEDERYKHLVGKQVHLPLTDRKIPIIADDFVGVEFGTGMVKVTPAHDFNDWECGKRHNLKPINILNTDGTLNENCPDGYVSLSVTEARTKVVSELEKKGYLSKTVPYNHDVGHCYRCKTIVEPFMSLQWFVKMKPLADKALKAWKEGKIKFYPVKWENTYSSWLENIKDWCISRQLWWGHRIPVWYCEDCKNEMASRTDVTVCSKCGSTHVIQDPDVLDTWFSSWLWPFSILGWPNKTDDLSNFFPTSSLVTGYDIIFFWVSRMIMSSLVFMDKVPFQDVYLTGLVRDKLGRKMAKSLGNGIDPLNVINIYGADAMKFTLCYMATQGQDILIDMDSFKLGSRFANKIWNAVRFILMNINDEKIHTVGKKDLKTLDKWIYHTFNETVLKVSNAIESYKFSEATQAVYSFFWNDFCDWYLEASKISLNSDSKDERSRIISIFMDLLEKSLRLLHPFMSFLTEELYSKLPNTDSALIIAPYPEYDKKLIFEQEVHQVHQIQEIIKSVRNIRSELNIKISEKIVLYIRLSDENVKKIVSENIDLIKNLTNSESVLFTDSNFIPNTVLCSGLNYDAFIDIKGLLDPLKEISRLEQEIEKNEKSLKQVMDKLNNDKFKLNAKREAIDKEYSKKTEFENLILKSQRLINLLKNSQY